MAASVVAHMIALTMWENEKPVVCSPMTLTISPDGLFIISNDGVLKYTDYSGELKKYYYSSLSTSKILGLAFNSKGLLHACDLVDDSIFIIDKGILRGKLTEYLYKQCCLRSYRVWRIAIDAHDNLFITCCQEGVVMKFSSDYAYVGSVKLPAMFPFPKAVAVNSRGDVFVGNSVNGCIYVFTGDLEFIFAFKAIPGNIHKDHAMEFCIDKYDRVIISDYYGHVLRFFDLDGKCLGTFGSKGEEPGQFKYPHGVAMDDQNRIVVVDSENSRLQIIRSSLDPVEEKDPEIQTLLASVPVKRPTPAHSSFFCPKPKRIKIKDDE